MSAGGQVGEAWTPSPIAGCPERWWETKRRVTRAAATAANDCDQVPDRKWASPAERCPRGVWPPPWWKQARRGRGERSEKSRAAPAEESPRGTGSWSRRATCPAAARPSWLAMRKGLGRSRFAASMPSWMDRPNRGLTPLASASGRRPSEVVGRFRAQPAPRARREVADWSARCGAGPEAPEAHAT